MAEDKSIPYETDNGVVVAVDLDGTVHRMRPVPVDEREALARVVHDFDPYDYGGFEEADTERLIDAILAAGFRRQGPITDDDYEVAWFCEWDDGSGTSQLLMGSENWGPRGRVFQMRRRKPSEAGPWEPLEAARDAS